MGANKYLITLCSIYYPFALCQVRIGSKVLIRPPIRPYFAPSNRPLILQVSQCVTAHPEIVKMQHWSGETRGDS